MYDMTERQKLWLVVNGKKIIIIKIEMYQIYFGSGRSGIQPFLAHLALARFLGGFSNL